METMSLLREGYGDVNRAFLQGFMSRRTMKIDDIKILLAEILSADGKHVLSLYSHQTDLSIGIKMPSMKSALRT